MDKPRPTTSIALVPSHPHLPADEQPARVYASSLSPNGRRAMEDSLRRIAVVLGCEEWRALPWHKLRYQHVQAIRTKLLEGGYAPATVNLDLQALRGVAKAAFNLGHINADELQRIRNVALARGERLPAGRALKPGEIAALFRACEEDEGPAGPRDAAMFAVMYVGGLRRAEVAALDLADYDPDAGELRVRGKGNRERLVHLANNGTSAALTDWLSIRGDEGGPLFVPIRKGGTVEHRRMSTQAVYNTLRKRSAQAAVKTPTPHDMRRTFISDLLDAGADISTVQHMAGHASVTTTARYDRRGEEAKKQAAGLLHVPYRRRTALEEKLASIEARIDELDEEGEAE